MLVLKSEPVLQPALFLVTLQRLTEARYGETQTEKAWERVTLSSLPAVKQVLVGKHPGGGADSMDQTWQIGLLGKGQYWVLTVTAPEAVLSSADHPRRREIQQVIDSFSLLEPGLGQVRAELFAPQDLRLEQAQAHYQIGASAYRLQELDDAIRELARAIEIAPEHARPHSLLGYALLDKGALERGMSELNEAVRLNPEFDAPHVGLARAWEMKGDLKQALAELSIARKLTPDDPTVQAEYQRISEQLGK